ncbi:outer membrane protein assembly factor BamB family protein [Georgenia subflava]|uniref:Pyrrolo-quinoline quinone repeat domain-containing protein n=1 Tax=Georgenia subflava TaxID=1622177 RepID=A0A6N7EDH0_9MICO|nr:PQQ-binding-like beta-propeller repeat protein [Georgenia subflava]MPV36472.1 hypothetical protein [Georgenia subflava]
MRTVRRLATAVLAGSTLAAMLGAAAVADETEPAPAAAQTGTVQAGTVPNHSFEELSADGTPVGWGPLWASSVEYYSVTQERASDGATSIHMLDTSTSGGGGLVSDPVPVEAGQSYQLSFDQFMVSGAINPTIYFDAADGSVVAQPYQTTRTAAGRWERAAMVVEAPEGAVAARLTLYTASGGLLESYVDNVAFTAIDVPEPVEPEGFAENLGEHLGQLNAQTTGLTHDSDGRQIALFGSIGSPLVFSAVDAATGELLMQQEMPGTAMTWSFGVAEDGTTYVGTYGSGLWVFDPETLELTQVQDDPLGETHLYSMDMHDDGRVFIGTYPNGKVLSYDPATGEWVDHGRLREDVTYAQSLDVDGDKVFVGTAPVATTFVLDLAAGTKTEIPLPEPYDDERNVSSLGAFEGKLFALTNPSRTLLVYDRATAEWTHEIADVANRRMAPARLVPTPDGERLETYFQHRASREVRAFDLESGEIRSLPFTIELNSMSWYWGELELDGFPGTSLIGTTQRGVVYAWNPETGDVHRVEGEFAPSLAWIRSLSEGPDGKIYMGGYASDIGAVQYDPGTDEVQVLRGPPQIEQFGRNGDSLLIGTYGGATIFDYDTTQPWVNGQNPRARVYSTDEQDRVTSFAAVDENLTAFGSYPFQGQIGGALSFYDHDARTIEVHRNVVQDQTPLALVYRDGLIYGGTGVAVGLGAEPTTTEGHLFVYDVAAREVVYTGVPVPGEENVAGLAFDETGILWGMTGTTLFSFDPVTRQVVDRIVYDQRPDRATYVVGRGFRQVGDTMVGLSRCTLFEFYPDDGTFSILATHPDALTCTGLGIDDDGRYYYGAAKALMRWTPDRAPACDAVVTGHRRGPLAVGAGTTCLDDATIEGPVTVTDGAGVVVTGSTVDGPLRTDGASVVHVLQSTIDGPVELHGTTGELVVTGTYVTGPLQVTGTRAGAGTVVVAGNTISGPLRCEDNDPAPTNEGEANSVSGPRTGQCAGL